MRQTIHPSVFLGTAVLLCTAWLWARPAAPAIQTLARSGPRPALVEPASIELDTAILERYAGTYRGRGDFTVDLILKDGKLVTRSAVIIESELRATSETKFFLKGMGIGIDFDVARDGTVRGFAASTEYGLIELKRAR